MINQGKTLDIFSLRSFYDELCVATLNFNVQPRLPSVISKMDTIPQDHLLRETFVFSCKNLLVFTSLSHTLYCHPGFLFTNKLSKIHYNLFALKINVIFLTFILLYIFNTLDTSSTLPHFLFDFFQKLTKLLL